MAHKFSLYDYLLENSADTVCDWKKNCTTINSLPLDYAETIYALILHHYLLEMKIKCISPNLDVFINQLKSLSDNRKSNLQQPYGVRLFNSSKGVTFLVNNLPDQLQKILSFYISSISQ